MLYKTETEKQTADYIASMKSASLKNVESQCKQIVKELTNSHIVLATFNKLQVEIRQ